MTTMTGTVKNIFGHISRKLTSILWTMAICCFLLSFFQFSPTSEDRRAQKVEKLLHKREKVLQSYVDKAFEVPADEWIRYEKFPEDMVLYRYIGNTLQSWVNTFPISNDNIGIPSSWYRIHDLGNKNIFNIPLAFRQSRSEMVCDQDGPPGQHVRNRGHRGHGTVPI